MGQEIHEMLREEYLKKIRNADKISLGLTSGEYENSGGVLSALFSSSSFDGEVPEINVGDYKIPEIKKWPEKIELSPLGRSAYEAQAKAFAQARYMDDGVFGTLDPSKFYVHVNTEWPGTNRIRKDLIFYLEELHSIVTPKLGTSKLSIGSMFRTWDYHVDVYKRHYPNQKPPVNSPHLGGLAVDIGCTGKDRYTIADAAYYMGFGGIAIGSDFVHVDIAPYGRWTYSGVPKYISPEKKYG